MAGSWLFCNRRWLDPRVSRERDILEANYATLCTTFPSFRSCSKARFIENVTEVCASWSKLLEDAHRQYQNCLPRRRDKSEPEGGSNIPVESTRPKFSPSAFCSLPGTFTFQNAQPSDSETHGPSSVRALQSPRPPSPSPILSGSPAKIGGNSGEDVDLYLLELWDGEAHGPMAWKALEIEGPEALQPFAAVGDAI